MMRTTAWMVLMSLARAVSPMGLLATVPVAGAGEGGTAELFRFTSPLHCVPAGRSCFVRNGGCTESCTDTHWGVQCSCGAGWVLQADGQSCAGKDRSGCMRSGQVWP